MSTLREVQAIRADAERIAAENVDFVAEMNAPGLITRTQLLVVDYFPEFHKPLAKLVPEATGGRYVGRKWAAQVPREAYEDIVDRLISEGFDVAPEKAVPR